jgi:phosphatidylglycerol:prolipoprotein diacylglycerol transferase
VTSPLTAPIFPYLSPEPLSIGVFKIQIFGLMVLLALLLGIFVYYRRVTQQKLNVGDANGLLQWSLGAALILSHVFYFAIYHPDIPVDDLAQVLNVFIGMSSIGGFLGLIIGMWFYVHWKRLDFLRYADVMMWASIHAWVVARIGCAFAHDHPGLFTQAWFSVQWPLNHPDQIYNLNQLPGRHDLGLNEVFLTLAILILLYLTNSRGQRFAGFNVALAFCIYAPVRFFMDFLRVNDIHYGGLTPAQYGMIVMFLLGFSIVIQNYRRYLASR